MSSKGQVGIPGDGNNQVPSPAAEKSVKPQRDYKARKPAGVQGRGRDLEGLRAGPPHAGRGSVTQGY